ncbi:MAG TPA: PDZ domain-containing protein, partial [Kofleriaceae bacterium]|nr:PDZ domain-containing protein [Kofleriaceae bacterium]
LYFMPQDGIGAAHVVTLGEPPSFYYTPRWSPDSKKIVLADKRLNLWLVDVDHPTARKIDTDRYDSPGTNFDPAWAPDSKWIVYEKQLANHQHAAFIYSLESHDSHQVTDGRSETLSARFDRGGKYLWFVAATNVGPSAGWLDMSSYGRNVSMNVYAIVLAKDAHSPVEPESDEEGSGSGSAGSAAPKPDSKTVHIDFDAIDQRIVALPIPRANYSGIEAGPTGTILLVEQPMGFSDEDMLELDSTVPASISKFDLKTRKVEKLVEHVDLGGANGFELSADGQKMLFAAQKHWFVTPIDHAPKPGEGEVHLDGLEVWVDPRAEWKQMFHEVWRIERDFLYDPKAHGLDLAAAEKLFGTYIDGIGGRADLDSLFEEMLGYLVLGHVFVNGPPPTERPVPVGLLGADFTVDHGHYRIAKILRGENWNPRLIAPLTQPGVVVSEGDYLLEVNGREVFVADPVERAFVGMAGKQTVLTVSKSPDGGTKRKVTVVPVASESQLRLRTWMEENRAKVDLLSGGRVGYVFIPDTAAGGFANFNRYFYSQIGKEAMVLDERFNHGGQIADYVINALQHQPVMAIASREGDDVVDPAQAIFGPKV